jgi:hypothetical protein
MQIVDRRVGKASVSVKRSLIQLAGLAEIGWVEVGENSIRDQLGVPLRNISECPGPILAPHIDYTILLIEMPNVSKPLGKRCHVKSARNVVR